MWEWEYSSMHSYLRKYVQVAGQLHVQAGVQVSGCAAEYHN
jgi:hypothetical protein